MDLNNTANNILKDIDGWQLKLSKSNFLEVKSAITIFVSEMQKQLQDEKDRYIAKTNNENANHDNKLDIIRKEKLDGPNQIAKNNFSKFVNELNMRWSGPNGLKTKTENSIKTYNFEFRDDGIISSIISSIIAKKDKEKLDFFENEIARLRSSASIIEQQMEITIQKSRMIQEAEISINKKIHNSFFEEENFRHKNEIELIDNEHRNNVTLIVNSFETAFKKVFNYQSFTTAYDVARSTIRSATGYTCAEKVPQAMYLGNRTFSIHAPAAGFFPEIVTLFREINHNCINVNSQSINITLPYSHTLEDGYSFFIESVDSTSDINKNIVRTYVMKILMNFPVGQTRPILLDNDSSTTLTAFNTIGESSGRGIVTRPWTKEEDITAEIRKMADEHSNLSISYGDDVESRLKREPIYFLAGRNFPKGFTSDAISSLSNIFLAGAKNGFFGLIQAQASELSTIRNNHELNTLMQIIINNSIQLVENSDNGQYYIVDSGDTKDVFEFDMSVAESVTNREVVSTIIKGFSNYKRQIEKFEYLFSRDAGNVEGTDVNDTNTWYRATADEKFEIPIGISGASTVQKYVIEGVAQHALISGVTGSGKSALLRTIICAAMMKYTPDDLNLYLIDYKEGVEFEVFSNYRLPWIKVIALDTKRDFALNVLQTLDREFIDRAEKMKSYSSTNVGNMGDKKFPRILLIFDEVQELLRENDDITKECINILAKLVSEGRAMNMNIILTSQDFTNCNGMSQLMANMVIRIAFKGSPNSAKSIMGEDFSVAQLEQGDSGYAAINTASGAKGKTNFFQAGYLDETERNEMLSNLQMTMQGKLCDTRVMSSHANQDRKNKFNRLICNEDVDYSETPENYDLIIGDGFSVGKTKSIFLAPKTGENILIVGENELIAKSMFSLSILSVLYDELASKAHIIDNTLIYLIDLSDEDMMKSDYFEFLNQKFPHQIKRADMSQMNDMIEATYNNLIARKKNPDLAQERLFFMFFGIDQAMQLYQDMYASDEGEITISQKLEKIIQQGPEYGINCLFWSHGLGTFKNIISASTIQKYIKKRFFYGEEKEDCEFLIGKAPKQSVRDSSAVIYRDFNRAGTAMFRPYEIPAEEWVSKIAETYKNFEKRLSNTEGE